MVADIRRCCPGVRLHHSSSLRFVCQLYADDLVILADSADLQLSLHKSAVMVFGPSRQVPSCSVTLDGINLPVVRTYKYLGVILTPSLRWTDHVHHLTSRGFRLFAQTTTWSRSEDLPVSFGSLLLSTYVLPSTTFGRTLQARALQHCLSSTDHSAGGVVIYCGGQRALLMRRSSANWSSSTRPAWLTVKLCPYLAA